MAKLNEGDVMEGVFAIALAQLFAYDRIDKGKLNQIRAQIEPKMFQTGRYETIVRRFSEGNPKDNIEVKLIVRLKYQSTMDAFGPNFEIMLEKASDVGNIGRKIDTLISYTNSKYRAKIKRIRDAYLKNNESDDVAITITADGIAGETSGGEVKGDLDVDVVINDKTYLDERLNFSMKSGSKTLANLSPFNGMMDILRRFNIQLTDEEKYRKLLGEVLATARTPQEKKLKVQTIKELYSDVKKGLAGLSSTPQLKQAAFQLFRDVTFGTDLAEVVDVDKTKVKEITLDGINKLEEETTSVEAVMVGDNIKFRLNPSNEVLFQLRFKNRSSSVNGEFNIKELKFYVEAGKAAYAS